MKLYMFLLLIVLCGLFFLVSCSCNYQSGDNQLCERTKLVNQVTLNTIEKLEEKYQLEMAGIGRGCDINELQDFVGITFNLKRPISKDEARSMVIDCLEEYLFDINNCENLRPYLVNNKLATDNVAVMIFISDENGSYIYYPQIALVKFSHNEITYTTYDPESKHLKYKTEETETYEEACAILGKKPLD